jgi:hypothetical protein
MWAGVFAGILAALAAVAAVSHSGHALPLPTQGAILGALAAVLLAPVIAIFSFVSMIIPFSLDGIFGGSIWLRLARANNERSLVPLLYPLFWLVGLPMTLGGFAGSHAAAIETSLVVGAGLGAVMLGAIVGGALGSLFGGGGQPS